MAGNMKRVALEIYALAVCFGAVCCVAIYLGICVWHVTGLKYPELTVSSYEFEVHQTDDAFLAHIRRPDSVAPALTPAELTAKRLESYANVLRGERHEHVQGFVQGTIGFIIALGVFAIHWVLARRVRASTAVA